MNLGKTTIIHFSIRMVISVSGFIATFAIARLLGAAVLGLYATTVALLFAAAIPSKAVADAVTKRMSEGVDQGAYYIAGLTMIAVITAILAAIVLSLRSSIDSYVGAEVSLLLILLIAGSGFYRLTLTALDGQKKVAHSAATHGLEQMLKTVLQVGLILAGFSLAGLIVGHALALIVAGALGLVMFEVGPARPKQEHFQRLYEYARYSWLGTLKARALSWTDTIVLALFVAPNLIGIYEVAWSLATFLALISLSIRQTLFPEFSDLGTQDREERVHHLLEEGLVFTGIFAIPGLFGAVILGPEVLAIYNTEFREGALILVILIGARLLASFAEQFTSTLNAMDRPDLAFRINVIFIAVNIVLNLVLIWSFGWYGAAVATTLSAGIMLLLSYLMLTRLIGAPSIPVGEVSRQIGAAAVMAVAIAGVTQFIPTGHWATILLVMCGAAVYVGVLLVISSRIREKLLGFVPDTQLRQPG